MKNGITISLLSLGLIACGGESSNKSGSPRASIKTEFSQNLRGPQTLPDLEKISVTEGDSLSLNTEASGSILEDSSVNLTFTAENTGLMTLFSASTDSNVVFSVTNNSDSTALEGQGRIEAPSPNESEETIYFKSLYFTVEQGSIYSIEVASPEEAADFKLTLINGNRFIAPILVHPDSYLVSENYEEEKECEILNERSEFIETQIYSDAYHSYSVMNWKDGYHLKSIHARTGEVYEDAKGDTFYIGDERNDYEDYLVYKTNFETGAVSSYGTKHLTYTNEENGEIKRCIITHTMSGKVVL
ncbi:MAG: hypothetical protein KBT75_03360 [Oleispira antarctica]|nr:hypothetical protein [Oleispira antarctica]MBQ0792027.1 hypothetical protein [Oleispira antarctica]|tara:strand:- start:76 stop:978 length:903 start_codon:yes stop_codon:yes gene_type:complete